MMNNNVRYDDFFAHVTVDIEEHKRLKRELERLSQAHNALRKEHLELGRIMVDRLERLDIKISNLQAILQGAKVK